MSREGYTSEAARGPGWPCMVRGCTKPGHQKPACPEHITALPYPAQVAAAVRKGAVDTTPADCSVCGETFDQHKGVKVRPVCPVCRIERDKARDRQRQAKRRAS